MGKQVSTLQVTGKVGNIVGFKRSGSKQSGAKFARVRTTDIKNPKTNAQLYQRAVAATVTKAYAAMKQICDHSFESKAVGAESMQYFNRVNMNLLRSNIKADIENDVAVADQKGVVVAPNSAFCTPGPYKVSEGTLKQNLFSLALNASNDNVLKIATPDGANQTVAEYLAANNIVSGDIFTIVGLGVILADGAFASQYGQLASQPSTTFGFIRLIVKETAFTAATLMSAATVADIFDIEVGGSAESLDTTALATAEIPAYKVTGEEAGYFGIIRSRKNSKLRSTTILACLSNNEGAAVESYPWGIKSDYLLNAWIKEADTLGQSRLILEGGNF